MKILFIISSFNTGGVESVVRDLMNGMIRLDGSTEIYLLVLSNNKLDLLGQLDNRIKIHIIPLKNRNSGILNTFGLFFNYKKIAKTIREISPDIIHTHVMLYSSLPVYLAMKSLKYKFQHFHTIHTVGLHYSSKSFLSRLKCKIESKIYKTFNSKIVSISPVLNDIIKEKLHVNKSSIYNISNGVDLRKFPNLKTKSEEPKSDFNIIYLARLDNGKNHITLLKAIYLVKEKIPNIKLHLIGDGAEKENITNFISSNQLNDTVVMHGDVQNVVPVLQDGDVGVFPSEFEGCSIAILEMMASGLPIICSSIPAFTSIFSSDEVLYFECFDYKKIADHIENLYYNNDKRNELSAKSLNIAKRFSLDEMISKHICAYKNDNTD
ncbi:MAG: glycosyltransferase family 4 protein [Bacteroidales bacterium]|nr:glycosyltransferase family 4 protein [Bacteroidales bacterium]